MIKITVKFYLGFLNESLDKNCELIENKSTIKAPSEPCFDQFHKRWIL